MTPEQAAKRRVLGRETFYFDELEEPAKETARNWWRMHSCDYDWWESIYEDFERICEILGITILDRGSNGPVRGIRLLAINFNLDQGGGSSFDGEYSYKRMAHKKMREYAPGDKVLHEVADELLAAQKLNGYKLTASIRQRGRDNDRIDIGVYKNGDMIGDYQHVVANALKLNEWLFKALRKEEEWLNEDEQVESNIVNNEYEFDERGNHT